MPLLDLSARIAPAASLLELAVLLVGSFDGSDGFSGGGGFGVPVGHPLDEITESDSVGRGNEGCEKGDGCNLHDRILMYSRVGGWGRVAVVAEAESREWNAVECAWMWRCGCGNLEVMGPLSLRDGMYVTVPTYLPT